MTHELSQPTRLQAARRERRKSRGQSLVEFAIVTPVLILMLAIAADFGRAFTAYITIGSAAREGASYGMQSTVNSTDTGGISAAALADASTIFGSSPSVSSTTGTDAYSYKYVQVTVSYSFSPILQIPPIPSTVRMQRVVRMRVLQ